MKKPSDTPKAIESKYLTKSPNESIFIENALITVETQGNEIEREGKVFLNFNPIASIHAQLINSEQEESWNWHLDFDNDVFSIKSRPSTKWAIIRRIPNIRAILVEENRNHTSIVDITYVIFNLLNFKEIFGVSVRYPKYLSKGRIILSTGDWKITIDHIPSISDLIRQLKEEGGYGITHVGKLEKKDGKSFTNVEAQEKLTTLLYFLSFVRGLWVSPILPVGYDNNKEIVWENWQIPLDHRWEHVHSWFPNDFKASIDYLPDLFRNFDLLMKDADWSRALKTSIHWYIECNTINTTEGAIVLAQTAVELLSWMYLVHERNSLSQSSFNKMDAADQIGLMLSTMNIPLEIPQDLEQITGFAKSNTFERKPLNGPRGLTTIRNTIVHPGKNKNPSHYDVQTVIEAKRLILWYLELTILRLLNYSGNYSSRVHKEKYSLVPWKGKHKV